MTSSPQRGVALLEALIAFALLSVSVLALARLQATLGADVALARERIEAMRAARFELERLGGAAAFSAPAPDPGAPQVSSSLMADSSGLFDDARVAVEWADREGRTQRLVVDGIPGVDDGALAASLAISPVLSRPLGADGRAATVPWDALALGDGRSAWRPSTTASDVWLFDDVTGLVVARCALDAATPPGAWSQAHLRACTAVAGIPIDGFIRWSAAPPQRAEAADDAPLAVAVETRSVPAAAGPVACSVRSSSTEGAARFTAYRCIVIPAGSSARWTGSVHVVPVGWRVGEGADAWRICRFARDTDGSGAVDSNAEHPAVYSGLSRPLAQQNFLVVRGATGCPEGTAPQAP